MLTYRLNFTAVNTQKNFCREPSAVNLQPTQAAKLCWRKKKNSLEKYVFLKFGFEEKSDFCIFSKHGGSEGVGMERIRSTLEDLENFLRFVFPL